MIIGTAGGASSVVRELLHWFSSGVLKEQSWHSSMASTGGVAMSIGAFVG